MDGSDVICLSNASSQAPFLIAELFASMVLRVPHAIDTSADSCAAASVQKSSPNAHQIVQLTQSVSFTVDCSYCCLGFESRCLVSSRPAHTLNSLAL